ncbi:MAG: hypothetical protein HOF35_04965 [Bacteroidetes bacterium]|nr:hypothetical protein [Bacteroidota bacterium]
MKKFLGLAATFLVFGFTINAQQTVGLVLHENSSQDSGYVLFSPIGSLNTYLIDKCGKQIHSWASSYQPGMAVYLLEDGSILRAGQVENPSFLGGGEVEKIDWDGNIVFSYLFSNMDECQHHDIEPLPNGNFLVIMWEKIEMGEAIEAGRNPKFLETELWPDKIIEVEPIDHDNYNVVWEWRAWDHMIQRYDSTKANYGLPKDHPEIINLNYVKNKNSDMHHFNAIDYNPVLDQILISVHTFNEIWIIDHSTTIAEAATHSGGNRNKGGDLLYRWGNPDAYNKGDFSDQKLFGQHDAQWICEGNRFKDCIMFFNNGRNRVDGDYSTVEIISTPRNIIGEYIDSYPYYPYTQSWIYKDSVPANFYSSNISGAQQLDGGNVLICDGGKGVFFEVDTVGNKVWEYVNPVSANGIIEQFQPAQANKVFRCSYYPMRYPAFDGRSLKGKDPIEINPISYICNLNIPNSMQEKLNNNDASFRQNNGIMYFKVPFENFHIQLLNVQGQTIFSGENKSEINTQNIQKGFYVLKAQSSEGAIFSRKVFI